MRSAGSVLKRMVPELVISKQKLRQAEGSGIVRLRREEGKQNLGFSSRPFVLCGRPVRKPPKNELLYERRNGNFVLQVTGHPNYGLPFGQDRIVPIYLATLAVRQQSQTIRFRTAAEMLETFGTHKGGKEYRRLVAAFERIFGATIFFGTDALSGRAKVVQRSRFSFFREAQIWYSRDPDQCPVSDQFENVIVLSDEFYREVTAHPIPADLEAVKVLAGAPAVLDLFMWLSYRCFVAKGQEAIPLLGPFGLASQIGSIEYARPRRFREKLDEWLDSIRVLWPECPAHISSDGESLVVDRASAVLMEQKICG
jgi:Plasmid encoded RepA protein